MAVRKLPNGKWAVELQTGGERIFRRLPAFATKADAQALEAKIRRDSWERNSLGRKDEPSLAAVIQLWLNATEANRKDKRNPRQNAIHLRPFVEGRAIRHVGEVAQEAIRLWSGAPEKLNGAINAAAIRNVSATTLSPATINRRLDVLRASTRWAWKGGLVSDNLSGRVPRLREENARQVYLTGSQIRKLASCAPNAKTAAGIYLAAYTGLRASELLRLESSDITPDGLTVRQSKTGKPRLVPLAGPARGSLSALPLGISYRRLIGYFWEARKAAGMPHVHFHDLRHSCASMLVNAGVDLFTVGKILGHSSPQTTARYAHLSDASVKKAMGRLR